jgi:flagellar basal body-associated protein FliL
MTKKKRRTELDIDDDILGEEEAEPEESPAEAPPPSPSPPTDAAPKRKINRSKLLLVGGIALGGFVLAAATTWGVLTYLAADDEPEAGSTPIPTVTPTPAPAPPPAQNVKPIPATYEFQPFLIPTRDGPDVSFASIRLAVEMTGPEVSKEIDRNLVLVRENIYMVLSEIRIADFDDPDKRKRILVDVAIAVNRSIQSGAAMNTMVTGLVKK